MFRQALETTQKRVRFEIIAWVILPDHVHLVIDPQEADLSNIMKRLKLAFAYSYRTEVGQYRGQVWQPRFWDHVIRDQEDLNRHIDYIHYNPVKHGLIADPFTWRYSSLDKYYRDGYYSRDRGVKKKLRMEGDFGE